MTHYRPTGASLVALVLVGAFIIAGGITSCSSPSPSDGPGEGWTEDLDAARAEARKTGKPILLDFTGSDWCGWCIKLHNEVFDTDEFKAYAAENLVPVVIDFPRSRSLPPEIKQRNDRLAARYSVRGYPTIVLLDPNDESELGRTGYVPGGPEAFIDKIKSITGK